MKTTVEIRKISPEQAAELLQELWPNQRPVTESRVEAMAKEMLDGKFILSPDAICLLKGKLANGQHRLQAVVASAKAEQFLVLSTDDEDIYGITDAGRPKKVSDILGIENSCALTAVSGWVMRYDAGKIYTTSYNGSMQRSVQILFMEKHGERLADAYRFVHNLQKQSTIVSASIVTAFLVVASRNEKNASAVKTFVEQMFSEGGNMSAAKDIRAKLINNKIARSKLPNSYLFALIIKAYCSFLKGTRPGCLKVGSDEEFPTIP